ncbi:hypothetical protein Pan216_10710 [Planctomycetes bacterium Pan216]|uniref:Uncharacterized protein n=1 Tax=Kolteria novifilia TaxID=2527975 RepID=A0A518AZU6_9BACT|nr:hypothetical protein Pan216_10710 [Planctomycetes bacterium Pan216]
MLKSTTSPIEIVDSVTAIFAVEVLEGIRFPDLINSDADIISSTFAMQERSRLW